MNVEKREKLIVVSEGLSAFQDGAAVGGCSPRLDGKENGETDNKGKDNTENNAIM